MLVFSDLRPLVIHIYVKFSGGWWPGLLSGEAAAAKHDQDTQVFVGEAAVAASSVWRKALSEP
jgi:hypothetical protein